MLDTLLHGQKHLLIESLLNLVEESLLEFFVALVEHLELVSNVCEDEEIAHLLLEETLQPLHSNILVLHIQLVPLEEVAIKLKDVLCVILVVLGEDYVAEAHFLGAVIDFNQLRLSLVLVDQDV